MRASEETIREMREWALRISEPVTAEDLLSWANDFEAAIREKETWLSPETYDELMRERQETLHELARLQRIVENAWVDQALSPSWVVRTAWTIRVIWAALVGKQIKS